MSNPGDVQADGLPAAVSQESVVFASVAAGGLPGAVAASRYAGATVSGPPQSGSFSVGDWVPDQSGAIWICTAPGSPGTWAQAGAAITDVLALNGGSDTAASAPVLTGLGAAGGTAIQLADLTRDYMVYLTVTVAGTATSVTIGHTSAASDVTIMSSEAATAGQVITFRLPAGWYFKWAGSTTAIGNQVAVGC